MVADVEGVKWAWSLGWKSAMRDAGQWWGHGGARMSKLVEHQIGKRRASAWSILSRKKYSLSI
jgi:hypothetical protein